MVSENGVGVGPLGCLVKLFIGYMFIKTCGSHLTFLSKKMLDLVVSFPNYRMLI